jgi:EAL domain-containing protein (putative c-di-GMP-specific phosphodiesterase class I)
MPYSLLQSLPVRPFKAGEIIFQEGDVGDFAYIVEAGEVEIWTTVQGQRLVLNVLSKGSLFGELALVDQKPRSASATAQTDCLLMVVTNEQVKQRIQEADPILRLLLLVVLRYFRSETTHFRGAKPESSPNLYPSAEGEPSLSARIGEAVDLIRMEAELREALHQQQFSLAYQPIINLRTYRLAGFEALIRWQSPRRGLIRPDIFIPLAEATSLIIPLGQWVIQQGLTDLKQLQTQSPHPLFMSFNIASRQIEGGDFVPCLLETSKTLGIPPQQIKLEILERALFNREMAMHWVQACRQEGFLLALDDFGTGYSSLQYLNEYKLDTVKIDKSFVQGLEHHSNSRSICQAVIHLAAALGMTVVAEGVETPAQASLLAEMDCAYGQGYLFAKPLSLDQALAWQSPCPEVPGNR